MANKKKKNPARIPVSKADVIEARNFGVQFGLHISLWAAKEYAEMTDDQLDLLAKGVKETAEHIAAGRITYQDITSALKEDYDLTVEMRLIK